MYTSIYICTYVRTYVCTVYTYIRMHHYYYVHTYVRMNVCAYSTSHIRTYVGMYCTYVRTYVRTCSRTLKASFCTCKVLLRYDNGFLTVIVCIYHVHCGIMTVTSSIFYHTYVRMSFCTHTCVYHV